MSATYAKKGSQRWLQIAVNEQPELLNTPLRSCLNLESGDEIEWLSPLARENFIEYRDALTFERCGVQPTKRALAEFWPNRGPMWDGLARTSGGEVLLVEAKAHIQELVSPASRASEEPHARIVESLRRAQRALTRESDRPADWAGTFYQYTNRLAHLHFLREDNGIPAHLVFVYFLNAKDVKGPSDPAEWIGAIKLMEGYLGLGRHRLSRFIHKVFVDVDDIAVVAEASGDASRA